MLDEVGGPPIHSPAAQTSALTALAESLAIHSPYYSFAESLPFVAAEYGVDATRLGDFLRRRADILVADPEVSIEERLNALRGAWRFLDAAHLAHEEADRIAKPNPAMLHSAIKDYVTAGNYDEALELAERSLSESDWSLEPVEWAGIMHQHGRVLYNLRSFHSSERVYRELIPIRERRLGPEHPDTLTSRSNFACAMEAMGEFLGAEREHRAVLGIRERVLGPAHIETLRSRFHLAFALRAEGRGTAAEEEEIEALDICQRLLGPEHPVTLWSRRSLADLLHARGRFSRAEQQYRALLPVYERLLGPEHETSVDIRDHLACTLRDQRNYAEAEQEYRALLAILDRLHGPEHPDYLACRDILGVTLFEWGKAAEAEPELRAVLATRERLLGLEHGDCLQSCHNLALALDAQEKWPEALDLARRAEDGLKKTLDGDPPSPYGNYPAYLKIKEHREQIEARIQKK